MSKQVIGQGPGNLVPDYSTKQFLAGGDIDAGECVMLSGTTGYTVVKTAAATSAGIGFAKAAITSGDWGIIVTDGVCPMAIVTNGSVSAGNLLVPSSTAGAVQGLAVGAAGAEGGAVGTALATDSGNVLAAGSGVAFKRI